MNNHFTTWIARIHCSKYIPGSITLAGPSYLSKTVAIACKISVVNFFARARIPKLKKTVTFIDPIQQAAKGYAQPDGLVFSG
jgi:hypothetical protein